MEERNLRKTRVGIVVSDKMDKTIVVAVKDSVQHPLYKKILKRTAKFKARDEQVDIIEAANAVGGGGVEFLRGQANGHLPGRLHHPALQQRFLVVAQRKSLVGVGANDAHQVPIHF